MKKILHMLALDFKLLLRDKISLYIIIVPAILSFIMLSVMANSGQSTLSLAVTNDIPPQIVQQLETIASLEFFIDNEKLRARVSGTDSVAGLFMDEGNPVILFEGNESDEFRENLMFLIQRSLSTELPVFESEVIESSSNFILTVLTTSLLMLAMILAGSVSGFAMVNEREGDMIRALSISPIHLRQYLGSRTLAAVIIAMISVTICSVIMGKYDVLLPLIGITLASSGLIGLVFILLGTFAKNQISAIAALKILMPLFLFVPLSSSFVSDSLQFLYYPLPMYWHYRGIQEVIGGIPSSFSSALLFITGAVWFLIMIQLRKNTLGLRR
jgi:hypothetical protein